jgi:hypothetical protein
MSRDSSSRDAMPSSSERVDVADKVSRPPVRSRSIAAMGASSRGGACVDAPGRPVRKVSIQETSAFSMITWRNT